MKILLKWGLSPIFIWKNGVNVSDKLRLLLKLYIFDP